MADVKATVKTAIDSGGLSNKVLGGLIDGRVKCHLDDYTLAGTEASGSTVTFGQTVPAGANVIAIIITVDTAQTSLTASIGDGNSATRYANASTSLQNAGTYIFSGNNYVIGTNSSDNQLKITTGGATATAGELWMAILFSTD